MLNGYSRLEIEATNLCNTVCLHCPHEALTRPLGKMDWETYQSVIQMVKTRTDDLLVDFTGMGEPLLNPLVYRFIASAAPLTTSLTTNASALTPHNTQRLLEANLKRLCVSFNGHDPVLYELMMGGLNFQRAQEHLRAALEASAGSEMSIWGNVSVTRQTQDHLAEIKESLAQIGLEQVFFSKCHHRGGFLKGDGVCNTPPPPVPSTRCDVFTDSIFVAWNGDVLSCCHDLSGEARLGSLPGDGLNTILQRKQQVTAEGLRYPICQVCNDLYRFMQDATPDGRSLNEWIYNLYVAPPSDEAPSSSSELTAWLYTLYAAENQSAEHSRP